MSRIVRKSEDRSFWVWWDSKASRTRISSRGYVTTTEETPVGELRGQE